MESVAALFSQMPSWWGVIFLILFAVSGRLFRDNWKQQNEGWQKRCWMYGTIAALSFCLMVFGSFDFSA